jgi:hypothetical protein
VRDEDYRAIKDRAAPQLFKIPGVNVVGIGGREKDGLPTGERVIKVFVTKKKPAAELAPAEVIPRVFEGVMIDVVEGGPLRRSSDVGGAPESRSTFPDINPYDPLRGGVSVAIEGQNGLGTLGCFLWDRNDSTAIYALTNHHVVAANGKLSRSRRVLHPGLPDSSVPPPAAIVEQTAFGIVAAGGNEAIRDAAIIRLNPFTLWVPYIEDIGFVAGTHTITQAEADSQTYEVRKRGSTTKLTGGVVVAVDSSIPHFFGVNDVEVVVKGAMVIRPKVTAHPDIPAEPGIFADLGDSGSVVVNDDNEVVGLLFGSDGRPNVSTHGSGYATPISTVLRRFEEVDHLQLEVARAMTASPTLLHEEQSVEWPGGKPRMTPQAQIAMGDHHYYRPLIGGAPVLISPMLGLANASTLGCVVTDINDFSKAYILTAYSALSAANTIVPTHDTRIGQPDNTGHCSHCCNNTVARFFKGGPNDHTPQAGLAALDGQEWLAEIIQVGLMNGSKEITQADLGQDGISVVKYGGGTGLTGGVITSIDVVDGQQRLIIRPNPNLAAGDQVLYFSQFADRGSVVVDGSNHVVGVLYDETTVPGERHMHGVAAPIKWVLDQLQAAGAAVEVPSTSELNEVQQAAAARVIEADESSAVPVLAPLPVAIPGASHLADRWRDHQIEVQALIRTNRRVAGAWRRYGGPALAHAVVRAFHFPAETIPVVSDGVPVAVRIQQLTNLLIKHGSAELRATLSALRDVLPTIAGMSFTDALRSVTQAFAGPDRRS